MDELELASRNLGHISNPNSHDGLEEEKEAEQPSSPMNKIIEEKFDNLDELDDEALISFDEESGKDDRQLLLEL